MTNLANYKLTNKLFFYQGHPVAMALATALAMCTQVGVMTCLHPRKVAQSRCPWFRRMTLLVTQPIYDPIDSLSQFIPTISQLCPTCSLGPKAS